MYSLFFIETYLIYNVVLLSGIQQTDLVKYIIYHYIYIIFQIISTITYYRISLCFNKKCIFSRKTADDYKLYRLKINYT